MKPDAEAIRAAAEEERGVLGGLLFAAERNDHQRLAEALAGLRPEAFERRPHRLIFEAITAIVEAGGRPGLVSVTDELRRRRMLDEIKGQVADPDGNLTFAWGALFVTGLMNEVFTDTLLLHDAARLRAVAAHREAARLAEVLAAATRDERPLPEIRAIIAQLQQIEVPT